MIDFREYDELLDDDDPEAAFMLRLSGVRPRSTGHRVRDARKEDAKVFSAFTRALTLDCAMPSAFAA